MINRRQFMQMAAATPLAVAGCPGQARENYMAPPDAVGMLYDSTLCVGCQACVFKCRDLNGLPVDPNSDDQFHSGNAKLSPYAMNVIQVWQVGEGTNKDQPDDGYAFVKRQCMHCVDANCVSVCPVSAMRKDPVTGIVTNDKDVCIGCRYCMVACPFNVPKFEYDDPLGRIQKCQLCNQEGLSRIDQGLYPGCVEVCPTGAVIYGRREDLLEEAKRRLAMTPGDAYQFPRLEVGSKDTHSQAIPHYEQHVYGEFEGGGTQVLVMSGVPFTNLGLPELEQRATGARSETLQHALYGGLALPLVALAGLVYKTRISMKSQEQEPHHSKKDHSHDRD